MFEKCIKCINCGQEYPLKNIIFRCKKCSSTLEVIFDYKKLKNYLTREKLLQRPFLHSRYRELYPVKNLISLQEGGTALIRSKNLEKELGLGFELYFKYEGTNPTGSFKDRGSSVEIAKALEFGAKKAVCASTGNMGASVAAYSAIANIKCSVLVPKDTNFTKIEQILAYGARVYHISGDYTVSAKKAEEVFSKGKAYLLGDYLYRREGTKSVGFEICEILQPDYVFCPVGNGTLITATWKAFREFKLMGFTKILPKMVAIQAKTCNPLVKAFKKNSAITPLKNPHTIAVAIECGDPIDGKGALKAIRESEGFGEDVSDRDILKARELLSRKEGLFAEPGGAAALAGIIKSKERIDKGSKVVCLVTGHGLKSPKTSVKGKPVNLKLNANLINRI